MIDRYLSRSKPIRSKCGDTSLARTIGNGIAVRNSTIANAGRGLFATIAFRKGDTITEYDGEVIDIKEANRRRQHGLHSHIRSLVSGRLAVDGRLVKAEYGKGGASFINDIRDTTRYNAKLCNTTKLINGVNRSGLPAIERSFARATTDIPPGQEIFVNYGNGYWK